MPKTETMYKTNEVLQRTLRVRYPPGNGRIVLRTELDWDADLKPRSSISSAC